MITVHHLENSRSQRVIWLLEELGVDYDVKRYRRHPETILAPPELKDVHPLGKSPVITDGDITVAESGAIMEYLLDKFDDGLLKPTGAAGREFTYWLHYAEGSLMPLLVLSLVMTRIETAPMPFFAKPIARGIVAKVRSGYLDENLVRNMRFVESTLEQSPWFCGATFTAADIQMSYCLEAAESKTDLSATYPKIHEFVARIRERDAYQRALEAGGPYVIQAAR